MTTSEKKQEKSIFGRLWPWGLGGLLFAGVATNITMVIIAVNDPSFAVEHNYYQKALRWDKTMAQRRLNKALGWKVKVTTTKTKDNSFQPTLRLVDDKGKALEGASVLVTMFHSGRASKRIQQAFAFLPKAQTYQGRPVASRRGMWVFEVKVMYNGKRFTSKKSLWVGKAKARG